MFTKSKDRMQHGVRHANSSGYKGDYILDFMAGLTIFAIGFLALIMFKE